MHQRLWVVAPLLVAITAPAQQAPRQSDQPVSPRRRDAVLRRACTGGARRHLSRVRFRPGESRPLSPAPDHTDLPRRRLADLGSAGPAVRRPAAGRRDVRERTARPRPHDHRRGGGRPVRVDLRQRCRRRGQADRCLSRGRAAEHLGPGGRSRAWAVCALRQRLRATHRHGGPARPISRELRAPAPAHSEHAARVEDPAPRPGPRL